MIRSFIWPIAPESVRDRGVKGRIGWRVREKQSWTLMLHWRWWESCSWKTVWRDLLWPLIVVATCCVARLSGTWCWVSISTWSCGCTIRSSREGRWRDVAVALSPSWIGTHRHCRGREVTFAWPSNSPSLVGTHWHCRGREVIFAWPSNSPWRVGSQSLTRWKGSKVRRNNDQGKPHLLVKGKTYVQIHLGNKNIWRGKIRVHQKCVWLGPGLFT